MHPPVGGHGKVLVRNSEHCLYCCQFTENRLMPNRRDQPDTNILLVLRRWIRKLLAAGDRLGYRSDSFRARLPVLITCVLWLLIAIVHFSVSYEQQVPPLPFLPLYAFYPGVIISGQTDSHPAFLHAWGIGAAIVFFALAFAAVRYKNKSAGITFLALFLISTVIVYARVVDQMRSLH